MASINEPMLFWHSPLTSFFAFSYADIFIWYSTRNPCYRRENPAMPL